MPVRTVAVEEDGVVTDVSDYTDCSSTDEDVLKVGFSSAKCTTDRFHVQRILPDWGGGAVRV